jgi:hypothetical protein
MRFKTNLLFFMIITVMLCSTHVNAEDSDISRSTLRGLKGIYVLVENMQSNIQKIASESGLTTTKIQKDIENELNAAMIRTLSRDEWLKTKGRPVLYVNVNTYETKKYWYSYDIKLELRQLVNLENDPQIKTLADTWSMNITGMANIGNLIVIKKDMTVLLERFIQAYKLANKQK